MSKDEPPGNYVVGYGKPPAQHRFQLGASGNPKGRPRKPKTAKPELNPAYEPTIQMLLAEAYRPVSIREGDTQIELPAIQAVFRSMGVAAIKGNRHAAREFAGMVNTIEASKREQQFEYFKTMYEYRESWLHEFERCDRLGIPRPRPAPHPDDITLNPVTCEVTVNGPWTDEQADVLAEICERRDEWIEENATLRRMSHKKGANPALLKLISDNLARIARFDEILPERLRHRKDPLAERLQKRREAREAEALRTQPEPTVVQMTPIQRRRVR